MITCQTYTYREDGKHTFSLTLPCFSGTWNDRKDDDFYAAARMNRFYGHAAGALYDYARSFNDEKTKKLTFLCRTDTDCTEDGIITVKLHLTLRRTVDSERCPTLKKSIVHRWRGGVLIGSSIP